MFNHMSHLERELQVNRTAEHFCYRPEQAQVLQANLTAAGTGTKCNSRSKVTQHKI